MTDPRVEAARQHMARWETKRESAQNLFPVIDDLFAVIEDLELEVEQLFDVVMEEVGGND